MVSEKPLEEKREAIGHFLSFILYATFDDEKVIAPLEWILAYDAINVLKNILSLRSEHLSGFSLLGYIEGLIHDRPADGQPLPDPGFYAELRSASLSEMAGPALAEYHTTWYYY